MRHAALLLLPLLLAGCGGGGTTVTSARETDAAACSTTAADATYKASSKRFLTWVVSPVSHWGDTDTNYRTCMADKGWGTTRACTEEERRLGDRAPTLVVTQAGIRCRDPDHRT